MNRIINFMHSKLQSMKVFKNNEFYYENIITLKR